MRQLNFFAVKENEAEDTKQSEDGKLNLTQNAKTVLKKRYLLRDAAGFVIETPEGMFRRVADNIASVEKHYNFNVNAEEWADRFYNMMANLDFLPNSPTLMNAGTDIQMLSACFVLPVEDSMEGIFDSVKQAALVNKMGGGTGFSFSRLRSKNSIVASTHGVASGPISFINVFDAATRVIKQGGRRRGANMGILRVDHPDIEDFITAKKNNDVLNTFNLSVGLTEEFMEAVEKKNEYDLIDPRNGKKVGKKNAEEVFNLIVEMAWLNGEPGIVFLDRINADNPTPHVGKIEATNPCGEQPLLPYESCNLGSINLSNMVTKIKGKYKIDEVKLIETTRLSTRFLDNVIDANKYPLKEIENQTKGNRKIGLGVMGYADLLYKLGIRYDSKEALKIGKRIMKLIKEEAFKASIELGKERGSFPNFKGSIYDNGKITFLRNATTTTIAPTGTISLIAGTSSGIEPVFALAYTRNVMDNDKLVEINFVLKETALNKGFYSEELMKKIAEKGSIQDIEEIPDDVKNIFITAHDVTPEWHTKTQATFQEYVDNAVSKTVNFHSDATRDDVKEVYIQAYKHGCKGVTIYRDGSREGQVLTVGNKSEKSEDLTAQTIEPIPDESLPLIKSYHPRNRPALTIGMTEKIKTGCGSLYVTINEDDNGACELFAQMGKSGGCASSQSEAVSRLISLVLRSGIPVDMVVKHLRGIRCHSPAWGEGGPILSCPDAIAIVLEHYINRKKSMENQLENIRNNMIENPRKHARIYNKMGACPECGSAMEHESGCTICRLCGFSKCG